MGGAGAMKRTTEEITIQSQAVDFPEGLTQQPVAVFAKLEALADTTPDPEDLDRVIARHLPQHSMKRTTQEITIHQALAQRLLDMGEESRCGCNAPAETRR